MVKRALLIGINYNDTEYARLYGCINDAMAMHNLLIDAYGYSKSNITVLRDDNVEKFELPTKENMLKHLNNIVKKSKVEDEIWIHYSGHGSYIWDKNNDEFDGQDEVLLPCDYAKGNLIVDDELRIIFNDSKGSVYITSDCCHSGTGWDLPYLFRRRFNNSLRGYRIGEPMQNKQIYMLSGSRDYQTAMDSYNEEQAEALGAFTDAFIECSRLRHHTVTLTDLHNDINLYLKKKNFSQISELTSSNTAPMAVKITRAGVINGNVNTNLSTRNNTRNSIRNMRFM